MFHEVFPIGKIGDISPEAILKSQRVEFFLGLFSVASDSIKQRIKSEVLVMSNNNIILSSMIIVP